MRLMSIRTLAIGTLATFVSVVNVTAQRPSSPILSAVEVERLVSSDQPADHARLSAHFAALAERHTSEASRHASMSRNFVGNPSRNLGAGMSAHCRRLAEINTESAATVRELAGYHERLAAGVPATPPPDNTRVGAGSDERGLTNEQLESLAARASTPAEHRAIEDYFLALAKRYASDAENHTRMARAYRALPRGASSAAVHCDRLAAQSRNAAKEATEAAAMHRKLADDSR